MTSFPTTGIGARTQAGAICYLAKPFNEPRFARVLRQPRGPARQVKHPEETMTDPVAVTLAFPHTSRKQLCMMLGNAAGKVPDLALAQLHPESGGLPPRASGACANISSPSGEKYQPVMLASTDWLYVSLRPCIQQSQGDPPHDSDVACGRVQSSCYADMPLFEIARAFRFSDQAIRAPVSGAGHRAPRGTMVDALGPVLMGNRSRCFITRGIDRRLVSKTAARLAIFPAVPGTVLLTTSAFDL